MRGRGRARRGWRCLAVVLTALTLLPLQGVDRCAVCDELFGTRVFTIRDQWAEVSRLICENCVLAGRRCSICTLPVGASAVAIGDGRFLCARDAALVVLDDDEVLRALQEARREMDRAFARFTKFPSTNVDFAFQDQLHMQMLLDKPSFDRQCPSLVGYTQSRRLEGGQWEHRIRLLRGRPRGEMIGVYAHELAHAWARENVTAGRRMRRDAEEGFCELVACRVLEQLGDQEQVARVMRNNYSRGQVQLFQKACDAFEFNVVAEWMRRGVDDLLLEEEPDRVRLVGAPTPNVEGAAVTWVAPVRPGPALARDRLTLVGVVGLGPQAKALVNDVALGIGETGLARVGTNRVAVRCVAVGTNSVTLKMQETGEDLELRLGE